MEKIDYCLEDLIPVAGAIKHVRRNLDQGVLDLKYKAKRSFVEDLKDATFYAYHDFCVVMPIVALIHYFST